MASASEFDELLERLFVTETNAPPPAAEQRAQEVDTQTSWGAANARPKYRKIKKLKLAESDSDSETAPRGAPGEAFNFDEEFQKIVAEGRYRGYLPKEKIESPNSSLLRERVRNEYFSTGETYSPEVEEILKIHLQFPSKEELISRRSLAWTSLKALLKTLEGAKGSRRLYDGIQFYRMAVLAKNGIRVFVKRLPEIVARLRKILCRKCNEVEVIIILDEVLTTFEKRILRSGDYLQHGHRDFEKHHLSLALEVSAFSEAWAPLSYEGEIFSPHELMFFPLEEVAARALGRSAGRPKIMHLEAEWAWYRLSSVDESGKRRWKLDTCLDNLSVSLEPLMCSCIRLFEKLYYDRYQDREYRALGEVSGGIEEDLCTLLDNIRTLSNRKRCSCRLRRALGECCGYILTEDDVLDRTRPDSQTLALYESITADDVDQDWEKICRAIFFDYAPV